MNDTFTGTIGQPAHFSGDYVFKDTALPSSGTLNSDECILNNAQGKLKLHGYVDASLALAAGNTLTAKLQYKDDANAWQDDQTIVSLSGAATVPTGTLFEVSPIPSVTKRVFRVVVTSNFNASAAKLTCAVEYIPS